MGNEINNINYSAVHTYGKDKLTGASDSNLQGSDISVSDKEESSYIYNGGPSKQTRVGKTMGEFEDYLRKKQEEAKEAGEDERSRERAEKEAAEEIRTSLTPDEIKRLEMMGVDISSATMSDLRGMVNTLRGREHRENELKLLSQVCGDKEEASDVYVKGESVKLEADYSDKAADDTRVDFTLGKDELVYLLKNKLPMSGENLYKAHYSGERAAVTGIDDKAFDVLKGQLEAIIGEYSYENFDMSDAKFLLDNNLPVDADNIKAVAMYKQYEGRQIGETAIPETNEAMYAEQADRLYDMVQDINPDSVYRMAESGREISIRAAYFEQQVFVGKGSIATNASRSDDMASSGGSLTYVEAKLHMEEIRLRMTHEAAYRMVKLDVDIDTKQLSEVVEQLKTVQRQQLKEAFFAEGMQPTEQDIDTLNETIDSINAIESADAGVYTSLMSYSSISVTIRSISAQIEIGDAVSVGESVGRHFESVVKSYEAVGTAPRSDMGDRLSRAFDSIPELLDELGIESNEETIRAARILGSNTIDITQENVDAIVGMDRQVNELIDGFYPEAVVGLIKDGINPMDMPIEELVELLRQKNYNEGVSEAEDFATYLRDMEKLGEISSDERESYIGLYRVMNQLAKSGDAEAGYIFANRAKLTIRNLIGAMRSRKARGIEVGIDDSFGMLDEIQKKGRSMDEQIEAAFSTERLDEFRRLSENVEAFIRENGIEYTMDAAFAVDMLTNQSGEMYALYKEVMAKLGYDENETEKLKDEEEEHMAESMLGADTEIEPAEALAMERVLEGILHRGELAKRCEAAGRKLTELMYSAGETGVISSMDIASIKSLQAGFGVVGQMAKHDNYRIPVETNQGVTIVSLTMKTASAAMYGTNEPSIKATMDAGDMGSLTASIYLYEAQGEIIVRGSVLSDIGAGNERLIADADFSGRLMASAKRIFGTDRVDITAGSILRDADSYEALTRAGEENASEICRFAVDMVRAMADFVKK